MAHQEVNHGSPLGATRKLVQRSSKRPLEWLWSSVQTCEIVQYARGSFGVFPTHSTMRSSCIRRSRLSPVTDETPRSSESSPVLRRPAERSADITTLASADSCASKAWWADSVDSVTITLPEVCR